MIVGGQNKPNIFNKYHNNHIFESGEFGTLTFSGLTDERAAG
jgi:hypothetical protein